MYIDYGGISPVRGGGVCTVANSTFGRHCQASSNAVKDTDLLQAVAEKIGFFLKELLETPRKHISPTYIIRSGLSRFFHQVQIAGY